MKRVLKISIIIVIGTLLISGCGCKKKAKKEEEKIKVNTNEEVIKDQTVDIFKFTNTSLIYQNGASILETKITNTSNKDAYLKEFNIHIKNKDGSERIILKGYFGGSLKAGESKIITSTYGADITDAAKIEYEEIGRKK